MVVFFNFSPILNHLHPLQVENCGSNSRLVVDEYDNVKSGLKGFMVVHRLGSTQTIKKHWFCISCLLGRPYHMFIVLLSVSIFHHLKLELLTQLPASNDENRSIFQVS